MLRPTCSQCSLKILPPLINKLQVVVKFLYDIFHIANEPFRADPPVTLTSKSYPLIQHLPNACAPTQKLLRDFLWYNLTKIAAARIIAFMIAGLRH